MADGYVFVSKSVKIFCVRYALVYMLMLGLAKLRDREWKRIRLQIQQIALPVLVLFMLKN